jgi:AcrR family transcriptional regulator
MTSVEDRRVRRSRGAMRTALVDLTLEKGFGAVTIEEIAERADVARATFYAHYRDKEELLVDIVRTLTADRESLPPALEQATAQGFTGLPVRYIFEHAEQHRPVYQVILRGEGDGRALREFLAITGARVERLFRQRAEQEGVTPRIPLDLLAQAWTGELVGVLAWWVDNDTGYSVTEVTGHLRDLSAYGRAWASGLPPEQPPAVTAQA